jgi:hypothetical protein
MESMDILEPLEKEGTVWWIFSGPNKSSRP